MDRWCPGGYKGGPMPIDTTHPPSHPRSDSAQTASGSQFSDLGRVRRLREVSRTPPTAIVGFWGCNSVFLFGFRLERGLNGQDGRQGPHSNSTRSGAAKRRLRRSSTATLAWSIRRRCGGWATRRPPRRSRKRCFACSRARPANSRRTRRWRDGFIRRWVSPPPGIGAPNRAAVTANSKPPPL